MMDFKLVSDYKPAGSQPQAIDKLTRGLDRYLKYQTLLGVTGSGKTYTMANVIERVGKPTLVMAPNKTLAAQLYSEFRQLFPHNAVEYFVSYYDYYQPEAYLPATDTYIEKDADINLEIEKLRHRTTSSLLARDDVITVATVSAIYGLGSPQEYMKASLQLTVGQENTRDNLIRVLIDMHYERVNIQPTEGQIRVRGAQIDIHPYYSRHIIRVKADTIVEEIKSIDKVGGETHEKLDSILVFPAVHYILSEKRKNKALDLIREELRETVAGLEDENKLLEANRIKQKTGYDMELISELGYCKGIENYSRHLEGRGAGMPPYTLLDFYPENWLCFIDESHISIPQIRGMYAGDQSRKETLIQYGFRLPSARDNRPLNFNEFTQHLNQVIYVSATPGQYERDKSSQIVEQLIRPTGLIDPVVEVKPASGQVTDFIGELKRVTGNDERALVTTLTKRMSEDLADYLQGDGFRVKYLHSEIDTLERIDILAELREGVIEVIVGVNLLREGLDLPEVSLVAIMDADQLGFLRSATSLIQIIGRCSRNVNGRVILYADRITDAMQAALNETSRRRMIQFEYNRAHNIKPRTIEKRIHERIIEQEKTREVREEVDLEMPEGELERLMEDAAGRMDFEQAIYFRDLLKAKKNGS
ncbi:MAG: excinuclease ABC subunit UvrB [Candidatus Altiarchaeota archaeon]|nr:excinuclease ABC subunit UvrB [Candidatus Altiarchaeota archaeon]